MDLPKFISLIQEKSIYLAKMAAFDDALEGGLTVSDFFKVSNSPAIIDLAINGFLPVCDESPDERNQRLSHAKNIQCELRDRRFKTPFGEYKCDEAEQLFPICRQWLYVSCWHKSPHECSAMWKIYGSDKNSICIFTSADRLKASVSPVNSFENIDFREVQYINHIEHEHDLSSDPMSAFISKSRPYAFENEFRVIAWNSNVDLSIEHTNSDNGAFLDVDLNKLIEKIVVSPYSDPWFKNAIEKLCNEFGISVDVTDSEIRRGPIKDIYDAMSYNELNQSDS
jgi:hypothetical protein